MRVTLDIDEEKMRSIEQLTGQQTDSSALAAAVEEFLEYRRRKAFVDEVLAGKIDYQASNEEIEAMAHPSV